MNPHPSPIRVLLADDHAVVRAGIRQYLEQAGDIEVIVEAEDGQEACDLASLHLPDVAVLDIQMPKRSGIEVSRWLRAHHRLMGILVLTAYDDDPYVMAVLKAGANGYVLKTAHPQEIIQAVREVHGGRSVLDKTILPKVMAQLANQDASALMEDLTGRELEILTLIAKGYTNKAAALQLGISDRTVQGHLAHIFGKLQAASRTEAVMRAVSLGLIPPDLGELDSK
jgi:two-component system, NarL family, response regulator LiaR